MGIQYARKLHCAGRAAAVLLSLVLGACASSRHVAYEPAPGSYFTVSVEKGDNLSKIARRYQVGEEDVVAINTIYDRDGPLTGSTVRVPAYGHLKDPRVEDPRENHFRDTPVDSQPLAPLKGERGGKGGKGKGKKPTGDETQTADNGGKGKGKKFADEEPPHADKAGKPGKGKKQDMAADAPRKPAANEQWWNPFALRQDEKDNTPPSTKKFLWPVQGRLLASFGGNSGGERNDGINIQTKAGTPIHAADGGTVTYVGNELKGYGNLVLIRHENGYVTAYAHSDTIAVQKGDAVKRGQVIAYVGATGDVTQPQLHFELRLNTKPIDPTPYLVPGNQIASN